MGPWRLLNFSDSARLCYAQAFIVKSTLVFVLHNRYNEYEKANYLELISSASSVFGAPPFLWPSTVSMEVKIPFLVWVVSSERSTKELSITLKNTNLYFAWIYRGLYIQGIYSQLQKRTIPYYSMCNELKIRTQFWQKSPLFPHYYICGSSHNDAQDISFMMWEIILNYWIRKRLSSSSQSEKNTFCII